MDNYNMIRMQEEQREEKEIAMQSAVDFETECLEPTKLIEKFRQAIREHVGIKIPSHVVEQVFNDNDMEFLLDEMSYRSMQLLATAKCENDIEDAA